MLQDYTYVAGRHWLAGVSGIPREYDAAGNTTRIGSANQGLPPGGCVGCPEENPGPGEPGHPGPGNPPPSETQGVVSTTSASTPDAPSVREFEYDDANRMRAVKHGGIVAMNYLYNGKGERVYRYGNVTAVTTVYDEAGRWIGDYDSSGQPIQQAIWLDDLPVGLLVGAGAAQKLYYIEADALGTSRVVIDPVRNVAVWRWDLAGEAFGDGAPEEDADADGVVFVFDMRFPGQRYDSATGMHYNYFRDYDPGTGRYVQSDPIGLAGGLSTYAYAFVNPLRLTDALGLKPGDCYRSPQAAAANAIADINAISIAENREYAGWVYMMKNGWYSYTAPLPGSASSSSPGKRPAGAIGIYHTHGAWDPAFVSSNGVDGNEVFSRPPYGVDLAIPIGDWAFLGTPRGRLWQYRNNGRNSVPESMKPASPNNADACDCKKRNNYDDISQVWWRFLTGD
jgi:RHS repeat-associated protein